MIPGYSTRRSPARCGVRLGVPLSPKTVAGRATRGVPVEWFVGGPLVVRFGFFTGSLHGFGQVVDALSNPPGQAVVWIQDR